MYNMIIVTVIFLSDMMRINVPMCVFYSQLKTWKCFVKRMKANESWQRFSPSLMNAENANIKRAQRYTIKRANISAARHSRMIK